MSFLKADLLLVIYWFIAASSFIWTSCILLPLDCIRLMWAIGLLLLVLLLIFLLTRSLKNKPFLVVLLPILASLIGSFLILLAVDMINNTRFIVLAILISVFIGAFNFMIYFEDIKQLGNGPPELMHHRYIEYGRTFFWGMSIFVVAYLAWELQAPHTVGDIGVPWALANIWAAIQLVIVVGVGGALTFLGFHTKLREIERLK